MIVLLRLSTMIPLLKGGIRLYEITGDASYLGGAEDAAWPCAFRLEVLRGDLLTDPIAKRRTTARRIIYDTDNLTVFQQIVKVTTNCNSGQAN